MPSPLPRYRISVTPVQPDGHPDPDRCSLEFVQPGRDNWMQRLEQLQGLRALSCEDEAALVVLTGLLRNLSAIAHEQPHHVATALQPQLDQLLAKLDALQQPR